VTPTDFTKLQEKFPIGPGVAKLNLPDRSGAVPPLEVLETQDEKMPIAEIRHSTDEEKLNKTERAYLANLRAIGYDWIGIQCITLKLGDDCRYTPDLWTMDNLHSDIPMARGRLVAREVKGFMRDDALVKIKVAARMFPFIVFVLVRRQKSGGWETQIVKP